MNQSWKVYGVSLVGLLALLLPVQTLADGTESLGNPIGVAIAAGSDITVAGVGLRDAQPADLSFDVPIGNTVAQVLLYWDGQMRTSDPGDDTIEVDAVEYTGMLIGGPTKFFGGAWVSAYRADITRHATWGVGTNTINVGGLNFTRRNNGAGLLVILDDGVSTADIQVRDGSDLAYANFASPLDTTVPQTFSVTADDVARTAHFGIIAGGADGNASEARPDVIEITANPEVCDTLNGGDGADWDTALLSVDVPALANQVTTQLLSQDCNPSIGGDPDPESFDWIVAAFALTTEPPDGGDACTPGYWKNIRRHLDSWTEAGYSPGDSVDDIFGCFTTGLTLNQALRQRGGKTGKLLRFSAAALLNAGHADVDNGLTEDEVIAMSCSAWANGDWGIFDSFFDDETCPID